MASKKPAHVVVASTATRDLNGIWLWNAEHYGDQRADAYLEFLTNSIYALAANHQRGKVIPSRPDLRYFQIRRRSKRHGHIAVFYFQRGVVYVLHVFHTAQNWEAKL